MDLSLWMTFVATVALIIIPGPTVVLVLTYALTQGRRVAVASAAAWRWARFRRDDRFLGGIAVVMASATMFCRELKWGRRDLSGLMGIGMIRFRSVSAIRLRRRT
jgi:threonine/homoserine/homoserine lactone efflux protein